MTTPLPLTQQSTRWAANNSSSFDLKRFCVFVCSLIFSSPLNWNVCFSSSFSSCFCFVLWQFDQNRRNCSRQNYFKKKFVSTNSLSHECSSIWRQSKDTLTFKPEMAARTLFEWLNLKVSSPHDPAAGTLLLCSGGQELEFRQLKTWLKSTFAK